MLPRRGIAVKNGLNVSLEPLIPVHVITPFRLTPSVL